MNIKTCEWCKSYYKLDGTCGTCRKYEPRLRVDKKGYCKYFEIKKAKEVE